MKKIIISISLLIACNHMLAKPLPIHNLKEYKNNPQAKNVQIKKGSKSCHFGRAIQPTLANDVQKLISHLGFLKEKETNTLFKKHFASLITMIEDDSHDIPWTKTYSRWASNGLFFFQNEGARWETYSEGPRPLIMSFKSPSDGKNSFYSLFLPKNFDSTRKDYSFYMELHGSESGENDNPRKMLFAPLQPEIGGVTVQGYRKEGLFIYPWGRGDKWYKGQAENDIFECLEHFDDLFQTDKKRQYLYGFSMGGSGVFEIAKKTIKRWTAIGLYSGVFRNLQLEDVITLKALPVWMAWGENEQLAQGNIQLKDYLIQIGAEVKWTEVEGVGHAYLGKYQVDLLDWFLDKKK